MTWLENADQPSSSGASRLRERLLQPSIIQVPGAHDALSAILAREAGFECLYVSGAALTASMGLPDLGIMTLEELSSSTRQIYRASQLPLIVDADTGYGEVLNVMRCVRELVDCGAAAIQLEDQQLPKKCGHLNDKKLVSATEMAQKIEAARSASKDVVIVARTDAAADSFEEAVSRANLYREAGADVIFPEALTSPQMFERAAREIAGPKLANMTEFGRTPYLSAEQFQQLGFQIVIWPASSMRVAAQATRELYQHISQHGSTEALLDKMLTRTQLYEAIGYHDFEALDQSIARSRPPVLSPDPE